MWTWVGASCARVAVAAANERGTSTGHVCQVILLDAGGGDKYQGGEGSARGTGTRGAARAGEIEGGYR